MATKQYPRTGIGLFVVNSENKFLLGLRKGSLGSGTLGLPGGHLELNETWEDCASRELLEEAGIKVTPIDVKFLTATNGINIDGQGTHFITIFMNCRLAPNGEEEQQPELMEPEKCGGWGWYSWEDMVEMSKDSPERLFAPLNCLRKQRPHVRPDDGL